jgi:flavin-binding protein dodecin
MAANGRYEATSFESLQDAADKAFDQVPAGPEGLKQARIAEQSLEEGGFVGRRQYRVTLEVGGAGDYS